MCDTDTPLEGSYTTPPSTGGRLSPSPAPSRSPTPGDSNPENNATLRTEELEARIEVFLEEAEEDLEMDDLPLVENTLGARGQLPSGSMLSTCEKPCLAKD